MRKNLLARLPVMNAITGILEMPPAVDEKKVTDDWDFRNYSDDWLPTWEELKSKLISVWKTWEFEKAASPGAGTKRGLPVMHVPGLGVNPKVQCFGCGQHGHRRGDPACTAGPNEWAACTPEKFKKKMTTGRGGRPKRD